VARNLESKKMRTVLLVLSAIFVVGGCGGPPSVERQAQTAGEEIDRAIADADRAIDAATESIRNESKQLRADADQFGNDIDAGIDKADNAAGAAQRELNK
jgi:hypothetical protein